MLDFGFVTSKLRQVYLNSSFSVGFKNLGSFEKPDLYLAKSNSRAEDPKFSGSIMDDRSQSQDQTDEPYSDRVKPYEFAYLYESPDYCSAQPSINHTGTKNRQCTPNASGEENLHETNSTIKISLDRQIYSNQLPGSCEYLCCNRGFHSELVLYIVKCNCGFKFCCKVECNDCLRQRMQHYCS